MANKAESVPHANPVGARVACSLGALAITWFGSSIAAGFCYRDINTIYALLIWSPPFFAVGWLLVGIPIIAVGDRIFKIPKLLLGVAGAFGGLLIFLLPWLVTRVISHGRIDFSELYLSLSALNGLPAFGAADGASAVVLYTLLLPRALGQAQDQAPTHNP